MTKKRLKQWTEPWEEDPEETLDPVPSRYEPGGELRCVFYTLVVRNRALIERWKGGLKDYWKRYGAIHNDEITVTSQIGPDFDEHCDELEISGLNPYTDYVLFDASDVISREDHSPFPTGVDWLAGYAHEPGVIVFMKN